MKRAVRRREVMTNGNKRKQGSIIKILHKKFTKKKPKYDSNRFK